jgi:hypothetical protein
MRIRLPFMYYAHSRQILRKICKIQNPVQVLVVLFIIRKYSVTACPAWWEVELM